MKIRYSILFCLSVIGFMGSGCGTAYKVVMDQRNVQTQAVDEKIEMTIRKKLADSDQVRLFDISTYCFDGNVYLVGEYDLSSQKSDAINLAKQVEGVKSVTDYFLPKKAEDHCGTTDNMELAVRVKAELVKDRDISSTNIKIKSLQCNIVLLGLVSSNSQIDKAIAHAKSVTGVRSVRSFLKVY